MVTARKDEHFKTTDMKNIIVLEMKNVYGKDYPEYVDAEIIKATINGIEATPEELFLLNEDRELVRREAEQIDMMRREFFGELW
jgi:hypothetical protein